MITLRQVKVKFELRMGESESYWLYIGEFEGQRLTSRSYEVTRAMVHVLEVRKTLRAREIYRYCCYMGCNSRSRAAEEATRRFWQATRARQAFERRNGYMLRKAEHVMAVCK